MQNPYFSLSSIQFYPRRKFLYKLTQPLGHDFVRAVFFLQANIDRFLKNLAFDDALQFLHANGKRAELFVSYVGFVVSTGQGPLAAASAATTVKTGPAM